MTSSLPPTHTMRSPQFSPARLRAFFAAIIALLFVAAPIAQAQQTWNNVTSSKNWSNSASTWNSSDWWANPGGTLVFTNVGSGNVTNNMTDWLNFGSIIFRTNASSFNISGNSIGLTNTPKIENYSANSQTISIANLALRQAAEFNPVAGDLNINSLNVYLDGFALSVFGDNGRTLSFGSSTIISGTGSGSTLSINQNSTVLFQSAHTYAGDTSINAGTLRIASGGSANNSTFRIGASTGSANATLRIDGGVSLGGTGDIVARSGTSGTRTITTDAANGITATVSRNVYLDAGLTASSTTTGGTLAFTSTIFDMKSQTLALTGAGNFSISSALTTTTSGGSFTKAGAGTLTLSGSSANTFVGSSTVSEGVLILNKTANTAAIDGSLTINSGATLRTDAANQLNNELVTVNGTFNMNSQAQSLALAGSGSITLGSATMTINNAGNDSFTGGISGTGGLIKTGAGTQALSSANSYSGKVQINQGVLSIGAESALGGTVASLTADQLQFGGGTLAVTNGFTMSSNRGITLNSGGGTIEVTNGQTLTYGGVLTGVSGNNFTKTGAGGLTLSASNSSSLAGSFRILGGTVTITNVNSLGSGVLELGATTTQGVLVVNSNNTRSQNILITDNSTNSVINVASGQALTTTGSLTQGGTFANTTKFGKAGAGTLILAGSSGNTYNGQIQIGEGTVIAGTSTALGTNNGTGQRGIDLGLDIGDNVSANNVAVLASNGVTVGNSFFVAGNGGTRTIGLAGSGSATFSNQFFMNGNLIVDAGSSASDSVTISGNLTNIGGIIKTNAGILVLSASNNHSGGTTLGQGTLRINDARALGSGTFTISGPSTIDNTSGAAITLANNNAQSWNADFTFAGTTNLNLGTGAVALGASRQITVSANNLTVGGIISGSGFGLTKAGAGTLTLSGANTFSGTTTISGGVLSVGAATNLGASPVSVVTNQLTINGGALATTAGMTLVNRGITVGSSGGTINVGSGVGLTNTAGLYGAGALSKTGTGTLSLTNNNSTYSGTITVSGGTLAANAATSLSSAAVTVGNTGTLVGTGSLGAVTVQSGGTINPGNSPGTQTFASLAWEGGGNYNWQLYDANGAAGTGYDTFVSTGAFNISATEGSKFNINLWTLSSISPNDVNGSAINFVNTNSYTWTLGTFGSISGFSTNAFAINTTATNGTGGFVNSFAGSFSVSNNATQLLLVYTAPSRVYDVTVASGSQTQSEASGGTNQFTGASATVNKLGAGTLVMTNTDNSYTGVTTVKEGTLQINNAVGTSGNTLLGQASSPVVIGDTTNAVAAGFNFGAAVQNDRALSFVAGTGAAGRTLGTTITSGTATQAGGVTMSTNVSFSAASGGTLNVSGIVSGSGNASTTTNGGTVVLSGANTYTGSTTVSSNSTLVAANNTALGGGSGATTVNDGGTLSFSNNINEDEAITISGTGVGGVGALRNLSGANTNTGTVSLLGATNLVGVDASTSLRLGTVDAGNGTRGFTVNVATNGSLLVTGGILNGSGNITNVLQKDGTGNMTVSNNGTTGGMQLQIGSGSFTLAAGSFSTNTSTVGSSASPRAIDLGIGSSGDSTADAAFYAKSGVTVSNSIYVAPAGPRTLGTEDTSGTITYNNQIYLGTSSTLQVASAGAANVVLSGNITNDVGTPGASATLTKIGLGTLTLSASNDWRGSFIVGAGTAILNSANSIRDSAAVTVSNGASLNLNVTEEVGSITGFGNISLGGNQFRAGGNGANTTFSGIMSSSSDAATFVKKGTGTLTLAGANTMSGQSYLTAGTTLFTVNQGGTFTNTLNLGETSGTDDAILALGGSGVTLANPILVRGGSSNNTLTISALNTSGTGILTGGITLDRNLTITANSGGNLLITNNALVMTNGGNNNDLTITGSNNVTIASAITAPSGASDLNVSGTGTVTLSGNNSANYLKLNLGAAGGTLSVSSLNNLGNTAGGSYNDKINFNGGRLLVTEDLTIAANTFGMTVSANGGTIEVASGKTFTQNSFINGTTANAFNKTGAGTLVLGDTGNANSSTFNIREGTVAVTGTGALGTGNAVTLGDASTAGTLRFTGAGLTTGRIYTVNAGGGTIDVSNSATVVTNTSGMVFNGAFTKAGQGTLLLGGTGSGTGKVTVNQGTLAISSGSNLSAATGGDAVTLAGGTLRSTANTSLGSRGITIGTGGGTISVQSGTSLTNSSGLNGTANMTKEGSGSFALTGTAGNYSGTMTINNGTLFANTSLTSANATVASGGVLSGDGALSAVTIQSGGTIAPGNSPGTLSLGALTWEGGGNYNWQLYNATGTAGATNGYDLILGNSLNITASIGSKFNINLWTLSGLGPDTNGSAINFANTNSYTWTLGTFTNGITNFVADAFNINTAATNNTGGFANAFTGSFSITTNSTNLFLTYTAPDTTYNVTVTNGSFDQGAPTGVLNGTNLFVGSSALNKLGSGTLVMTNTNTYSGVTTIKEGAISILLNAPSGAGTNGALGGAISAVVVGDATNAVAAGFDVGAAEVTNSRNLTVVAGTGAAGRTIGTTNTTGVAVQAGGIDFQTNATLYAAPGGTMLYSGALSGAGNLTITNDGTSVFAASNSYSGTTTISSNATLRIANNGALGSAAGSTTVAAGGTLALSNGITTGENITISGNGVASSGALRNVSGANTISGNITFASSARINSDASSSLSVSNVNLGSANALTFGGAGTNILIGGITNVTASTRILKDGAGELIINNAGVTTGNAQMQIGGGKVTLAGGSYSTSTDTGTRALDLGLDAGDLSTTNNVAFYVNSGQTMSNSIYVAPPTNSVGTRTLGTESTSGIATFNREIYLGGDLIVSAAAGGTALFSGNITNIGNLTKSGNGTVILAAPNTFTGAVNVAAGTLALTNGSALNDANSVVISDVAGANLTVNSAETIAGLSGGGATGGTVTLNAQLSSVFDSATNTFAGVIGGSGALVKGGTGVMILSGANTFSGGLTQQTGTLIVGNNSAFGSGVYQVDFANNTNKTIAASGTSAFTLSQSNNIYNDLTIGQTTGNTGKLTFAGGTFLGDLGSSRNLTVNGTHEFSGAISGALGMIKSGSGTLILSGANTFGGGIFLDQGVIDLAGGSLAAGTIAIGGSSAGSAVNASNAVLRVSTNGTFSRTITLNGDTNSSGLAGDRTIQFANSGGTATLSGNAAVEKDFTINVTNSGATGAMSGNISGSGSLTKSGNGVLTLSGSNSFGGAVVVSAGTLNLNGGSALNDTNAVTVNSGGTLGINNLEEVGSLTGAGNVSLDGLLIAGGNGSSTQFSGVMSGAQGFVKKGAGTMTLSGANSYSGGTFIVGGTALFAANQAAGFSGAISLGETFGGDAAVLALTNGVNLTNALVVRSGSTAVKTIRSLGTATTNTLSGALTLSNGVTVESASGSTLLLAGQIGGTGLLTKTNDGAVALTASNTFTGGVRLNSGTILIGDNNALGTGTLQVRFDEPGTKTVASAGADSFTVANTFEVYNNVTIGQTSGGTGSLTFSGTVALGDPAGTNNRNITVNGNHAFSGLVTGSNSLTKLGLGTLTLSGTSGNTFTGAAIVSEGTLELNKTAGLNAVNGPITVSTGATLLLSSSDNIANSSAVTLSGGTITRGGNVNEVFGNLNLTTASFLDYGAANAIGTLSFGTYTPSSLLTVQNFLPGNVLTFGSDLTSSINDTSLFSLGSQGFTSSWNSGTSTFTITAIPEPSTYLAAAGLLAMFLWPVRRRLMKDAKSILGLRAPARDRIEGYRNA